MSIVTYIPPCYIKAKDIHFIVRYLQLPPVLQYRLSNFAKMENLNWKRNWRGIMSSSTFYIEKDLENFIQFYDNAMYQEDMKDRF